MPSDVLRYSAAVTAARWPVERRHATSRDPLAIPSKQRVAGSNPAGRADLRFCLRDAACTGGLLVGRWPSTPTVSGPVSGMPAAQTLAQSSFAAIAIALGQQITSGPPGCMAADPWVGLADLAKLAASRWTLARSSSSASTRPEGTLDGLGKRDRYLVLTGCGDDAMTTVLKLGSIDASPRFACPMLTAPPSCWRG